MLWQLLTVYLLLNVIKPNPRCLPVQGPSTLDIVLARTVYFWSQWAEDGEGVKEEPKDHSFKIAALIIGVVKFQNQLLDATYIAE